MLPDESMVTTGPRLLPRTTSRSMVLPQAKSRLMSVAHVVTKVFIMPLGSGLQPVARRISEGHAAMKDIQNEWCALSPRAMVSSRPGLLQRVMSGSVALQ